MTPPEQLTQHERLSHARAEVNLAVQGTANGDTCFNPHSLNDHHAAIHSSPWITDGGSFDLMLHLGLGAVRDISAPGDVNGELFRAMLDIQDICRYEIYR